jgi:uncharacterized protein (DUF885 family)
VIRNAALLTFILLTTSAVFAQVLSSSDAAKKLHALFDEDWQWGLQQYLEGATLLGDNRYNDRVTDYSSEAIVRRKAHERQMLDRVQKIDRSQLVGQDVISYDLFIRDKTLNVESKRFPTEYMIGELKIKELRARASKELGARFDVRTFHNAVLDDGPLPLDLLESRINAWIAEQKRKE